MPGKIEQLTGVTANTGIKLYRDKSINAGTKALFDVSSGWAGGKADVGAGAQIKSLSPEDSVATFAKAHTFSNGGMVYAGVAADRFDLPDIAAPQPGDTHWLFTVWAKITAPGNNSFNNQLMSFSTVAANTGSATMLAIIPTVSSGAVSTVELRVRGKTYVVTSALSGFYDGQPHQLAVECELSTDLTQQRVFVWLDKVQVYSSGWAASATTAPGAPSNKYIGTSATFPLTWSGSLYRVRKDDLSTAGKTAAEVTEVDYASSRARFS